MEVDEPTLTNFKNRFKMRLQLLKTPFGSTLEAFAEIRVFLSKLSKGIVAPVELAVMLDELEQSFAPVDVNVDNLIDDLENMNLATWKALSEFQERFFSLNIQAYQQSLDFQHKLNTILQHVLSLAVKKPKAAPKKKPLEALNVEPPLVLTLRQPCKRWIRR